MDAVLHDLRQHSPDLADQADLVGRELIRVAILWEEQWAAAIHEAHSHYVKNDIKSMIAPLMAMHQQMEAEEHNGESNTLHPPLPGLNEGDQKWENWVRRRLEQKHDPILSQYDMLDQVCEPPPSIFPNT